MQPKPRLLFLLSLVFIFVLLSACVDQHPASVTLTQRPPQTNQNSTLQTLDPDNPAVLQESTSYFKNTPDPLNNEKQPSAETQGIKQAQSPSSEFSSSTASAASEFNVILGQPTSDSITVSLYSATDMQVEIKFGISPESSSYQTSVIDLKGAVPQNVELTGLAADTTYYYQIVFATGASNDYTFHTQRKPGEPFSFTIDADPHYSDPNFNGQLYAMTLENASSDHPDFHIDLGDTFMTEKLNPRTESDDVNAYVNMRSYLGIIAANAPLFLVNGNHDGELGWLLTAQSKEPIWATQLRELYYPNPIPNNFYSGGSIPDSTLGTIRDSYYSWTWGDALFIVLDPFWYSVNKTIPNDPNSNWNYTLGKEQYDWLKSTLESSNSKYKFIFIHNLVGGNDKDSRGGIEAVPFFEWGGKNADGTYGFDQHRPGWGLPIHELLVQNHVTAVFHGHDHVFVKQDLDGIVYQEVPQPSITKYDNTGLAAQYGYTHGDVLSSSGHLWVTVSPDQVEIEYIRAYLPQDENVDQQNGEVAYRYVIQ